MYRKRQSRILKQAKSFLLLAFSDGCCPRIDWYWDGEKKQGSFIIQAEKVNGNCHYVLEGGKWELGLWMCGDSWWYGQLSDKGQCKGVHATTGSKPNVHVQDDSLQWKLSSGNNADFKLKCVDVCL